VSPPPQSRAYAPVPPAEKTPPPRVHTPALIARKRDGGELTGAELDALLDGYLADEVPDYQMAAFLMAVCLRGLTDAELERWTARLVESGERWDWSGVPGPKVGKHSTGGVGDKVSLVLAPVVAALGLRMPKVSGRGLAHTGGTLDKVKAIPGLRVNLRRSDVERLLLDAGYAIGGQTAEFTPLDGRLYALRDVTGTVESLPLIAASIVSKKVAEGLDALVLDVKVGSGAFLASEDAAVELARTMIRLSARFGLQAEAVLTSMEEPLGHAVGNALEVREAIGALRGEGPADLVEVVLALAERLVVAAGAESDPQAARRRAAAALTDGSALERFRRWVAGQGGDPRVVDDPSRLPAAAATGEVRAPRGGFVSRLDARDVGLLVVRLGGGRRTKADRVDPEVGVVLERKLGDRVVPGDLLATVHAASPEAAAEAAAELGAIYETAEEPPPSVPRVRRRIGVGDVSAADLRAERG
jgi:pyrimidine-nucleoside phosphorylase